MRIEKRFLPSRFNRNRGFYFAYIDTYLSEKYKVPKLMINMLRTLVIFYKKTREEITHHYEEALKKSINKRRQNFLLFILSLSDEEYKDITRLTKYDWDYEGEDSKMKGFENETVSMA